MKISPPRRRLTLRHAFGMETRFPFPAEWPPLNGQTPVLDPQIVFDPF